MEVVCFTGHHGTSSENAKKIRKSDFYFRSGWFGTGAYFYDDDREMARKWALSRHKGKRVEVIECDIEVIRCRLLDLCNPKSENSKNFHFFRSKFMEKANNLANINESKESLDCKIIDFLIRKDNLEVVRNTSYTYTDEERKSNKLGSNIANGIEICVANSKCIKNKK